MARQLLTKKREQWADSRDVTLKGKPLRYNIASQDRYVGRLQRLTQAMTKEVEREVRKLFRKTEAKVFFAQDASISSMARVLMNKLTVKYAKAFIKASTPYAESMVEEQSNQSKSSLGASLKKLSGGLTIKTDIMTGELSDILKASVAENVDLIKSIPQDYMKNVQGAVMRSITQPSGGGLKELTESIDSMLDTRNKQVLNKAKNVALDQTRKVYNNINAGRMKAVGVEKFIWRHSGGGQRPRPLHKDKLDGNTYSMDDLPIIDERTGERGIPGQAINCRCFMEPVIEFNEG